MSRANRSPEEQNQLYHRRLIPFMHSVLWLGALFLSCYAGWSKGIAEQYQKICCFLIIYCTFMFEGGLIWWDIIAVNYDRAVHLKDFGFIRNIFFNMALTLVVVVIYFVSHLDWLMFVVMFTAAWLKCIVCRIPSIIEDADMPYYAEEYRIRKI